MFCGTSLPSVATASTCTVVAFRTTVLYTLSSSGLPVIELSSTDNRNRSPGEKPCAAVIVTVLSTSESEVSTGTHSSLYAALALSSRIILPASAKPLSNGWLNRTVIPSAHEMYGTD